MNQEASMEIILGALAWWSYLHVASRDVFWFLRQ